MRLCLSGMCRGSGMCRMWREPSCEHVPRAMWLVALHMRMCMRSFGMCRGSGIICHMWRVPCEYVAFAMWHMVACGVACVCVFAYLACVMVACAICDVCHVNMWLMAWHVRASSLIWRHVSWKWQYVSHVAFIIWHVAWHVCMCTHLRLSGSTRCESGNMCHMWCHVNVCHVLCGVWLVAC
jgi:hypothetical protein